MKMRFLAGLLLLTAVMLPAAAEFHLAGYYKSFFSGIFPAALRTDSGSFREPAIGLVNNRLRLQLNYGSGKWFSLQLAYDLSPEILDERLLAGDHFFPAPDPGSYRWKDLSVDLYPGPNAATGTFVLRQNLDRLNFQIKFPWANLTVGRQVIAWGSARVVNPTDIISPFAFTELDAEDRRGVDAVRLRIPLGGLQELDSGWISGPDGAGARNAWYFRGRFNSWKTDWSLLLLSFRRHFLLGVDISRSLGGAGVWLEAAYVRNHVSTENSATIPRGYFRASSGIEYFFSDRFSGFCEYHLSTAGTGIAEQYADVFSRPAYRDGAVYLLGRHYLCLGGIVHINPLLPLTLLAIGNLGDRSLELSPTLEYNLSQNVYLAVGAYIGLGKKAAVALAAAAPGFPLFHSEFGAYPGMVFTSFRVYF